MQTLDKYTIEPIEKRGAIVGWRVCFDCDNVLKSCVVMLDQLPIPSAPTVHQIAHVAKLRFSPAKPVKRIRRRLTEKTIWTKSHEACQATAQRYEIDLDKLVEFLPGALESLTVEFEARELAKRTARSLTGLNNRDCERISDSGRDCSTIPHFDEHAQELCELHPELNWSMDDANSEKLFALLLEPLKRKPARLSPETIERAAEFLTGRYRHEIEFAEWSDDQSFEPTAELIPF